MLVLSTLHKLLSQVLSLPDLHTAVLLTPEGQLVSCASDPSRCKDQIRVVVGLSGEVWQETGDQGIGMVDSELGRIIVLPVETPASSASEATSSGTEGEKPRVEPLMLVALNATNAVQWDELQSKVCPVLVSLLGVSRQTSYVRFLGKAVDKSSVAPNWQDPWSFGGHTNVTDGAVGIAGAKRGGKDEGRACAGVCPTMRRWSASASASTRYSRYTISSAVTRPSRKKYSALAARPATNASTSQSTPFATTVDHVSPADPRPSPYALLKPELNQLRERLLTLLGSAHPTLADIAKYYFLHPSKQMRPLLVLLFSRATNGLGQGWDMKKWAAECDGAGGRAEELDRPLTRPDVLNDYNPSMSDHTASFSSVFSLIPPSPPLPPPIPPPASASHIPTLASPAFLLPTQLRLAQIVEMIHVASLLHDDVIDSADLRRGVPSAPAAFGNKLAVLGGDFLLGRASAALSRLGDHEVVELIASVIANLVEGEILQLGKGASVSAETAESEKLVDARVGQERWNIYLKKTYLKTATLMAKGARAAVILGGSKEGEVWKEVAYAYGRNLGIAFQLVDDILDYDAAEATMGKPGGADLRLGLATGPALYAWEEHLEMGPLIARKFKHEGDVELARDLVRRSSGVERTRDLAKAHADKAKEILQLLPDSDAKVALEVLTEHVVKRTW
ncbi:hypothetical protein EW146_g1786 [Bondarzewia mesenterica]|uniref:(2E,6E)-farnesyl diphosphate synthase n=1 Tax=Bondarzewia mesenterica TaxID=1095465 RepID=A0A4S4M2M1_9AGAM|nr:hypothetical protein EW146_g1786 [Bondarzewia mesenterica]